MSRKTVAVATLMMTEQAAVSKRTVAVLQV
jgi:hypothetical protein